MSAAARPTSDRVVTLLQARMSSRRLPGKVMLSILGVPMLGRQIERMRRARLAGEIVVATSTATDDDPIVDQADEMGIDHFRGSLDDVLDRMYRAAAAHNAAIVVRATADCPLIDPELMDAVVREVRTGRFDYVSTAVVPSFPDGLDVEAMTFAALERAWHDATLPREREHVTLHIRDHPERYRIGEVRSPRDLSGLRWTVDEADDMELVRRIYEELYPVDPGFTTADVVALVESHPDIRALNAGYVRNAALERPSEDGGR